MIVMFVEGYSLGLGIILVMGLVGLIGLVDLMVLLFEHKVNGDVFELILWGDVCLGSLTMFIVIFSLGLIIGELVGISVINRGDHVFEFVMWVFNL